MFFRSHRALRISALSRVLVLPFAILSSAAHPATRIPGSARRPSAPQLPGKAAYTITVGADSIRLLHVEATMRLADTMLYMAPWGAEHIPDGWRTFVKNERATDMSGRPVVLERIAGRKWKVKLPANSEFRLSYDVDVRHDSGSWIPDVREAGYAFRDRVFIVGRGLFVLPSFTLDGTTIRVIAPAAWKLSTPWEPVPAKPREYTAATRRDLIESTLLVGDFADFTVSSDGFSVAFAVGREFSSQMSVYEDATRRLLREHANTFGGPPAWPNMQVVINPNPKVNGGGGGVFRKSISMTFSRAPTPGNLVEWGHTLSHEFFHVWNASTLIRGSSDAEWLLEGGGDYFGVLALTRAQLISTTAYFAKLRMALQRYRAVAGRMSLSASGEKEAEMPQRELLYNGGWVVLFALDADIRANSGGAKSLDDVMRDMYQRTKTGVMPTFATTDFLQSVNRVSGRNYAEFFARYITGQEVLPVDKYFSQLGLLLADGGAISANPDASQASKLLLANYLASKVNK